MSPVFALDMNTFIPLAILILVVMGLGIRYIITKQPLKRTSATSNDLYKYTKIDRHMTESQNVLYERLVGKYSEEYTVFALVHLPTLLHSKNSRNQEVALRQETVDFVLCEKASNNPHIAIELAGNGGIRAVDTICESAELPLLKLPSATISDEAMNKSIMDLLLATHSK